MKKILIGTMIGSFISILLFAWGWNGMEKLYLTPKQTANQNFCNQLEICQRCNREYECLKNACNTNLEIKNNCQSIEENWKSMHLKLTPESFVSSLCSANDDFYNDNCQKKQPRNLKLELSLALEHTLSNLGILNVLTLIGMDSSLFGVVILLIPPLVGLYFGWVIYLFQKRGKS